MTIDEAIAQLEMDRDLCNFNPMTGEEEPMNEDCGKTAEALDMAIKALEQKPEIKVLERDEVIRKLGTVDIYQAMAWTELVIDLEYLGLKICEVEKNERKERILL